MGLPTRTVKPIVSFTPRFTATPIPSITPTPSQTSEPTETQPPATLTDTPQPTATPTVTGVIQSSENVNLRDGPGFDRNIVLSVPPGTEIGILSVQTDNRGFDWYKVSYAPDEGPPQTYWVRANLVVTDFDPDAQEAVVAVTPDPNRTPAPTPEPNSVNILAYCRQKNTRPTSPTTNDKVNIWWSWFVARPEYMQEHLDHATYAVRLDGELLENWETYGSEMKQEGGLWYIYWYYPVGKLSAGEHEVSFLLSWDEPINDGFKQFGPGTPNETDEGSCTFTVVEP
jgi:hypothetical protein